MNVRSILPRLVFPAALLVTASPSRAVMDIDDGGPTLKAGSFGMRVTNVGVLGNAFFNVGRSNDPSFEFPIYSGHEGLNHADLWVGALNARGEPRVSGGPMLEWRPTLAEDDRVREAWNGRLGSRRGVDDDGDGRLDEELLNARDDDGDGEVDEDLGIAAQQLLAADYTDDQPAAVNYVYPNSERHEPLGLSVHQEAYAWSVPGYDAMACLQFTITNHGASTLRQLYVGLLADLDSRRASAPVGHLNDRIVRRGYSLAVFEGNVKVAIGGVFVGDPRDSSYPNIPCYTRLSSTLPVFVDADPGRSSTPPIPSPGSSPRRRARRGPARSAPPCSREPAPTVPGASRTWTASATRRSAGRRWARARIAPTTTRSWSRAARSPPSPRGSPSSSPLPWWRPRAPTAWRR